MEQQAVAVVAATAAVVAEGDGAAPCAGAVARGPGWRWRVLFPFFGSRISVWRRYIAAVWL
jgi:hypothetical protein